VGVIGRRGLHGGIAVGHDYRGVYGGRRSPTTGAGVIAARPSWIWAPEIGAVSRKGRGEVGWRF